MSHKILVTGGSGFIGKNLAEQLAKRYAVCAPGRAELDLLNDAAVREYLAQHRFDTVIHSATGRSNRKVTAPDLFKNNCRMFFNLARNQPLFGRMLQLGSGAEFGTRVPLMPESFFDSHVPTDDYGFAKYIAAQYTETQPKIYNLRLFGVFGKYEAWDVRFISNSICRTLYGMPITMRQNVRFDYLDVDDLVKLTEWFIEHEPRHKTYNVCRSEAYELLSLARVIAQVSAQVSGADPVIEVVHPGFGPEYSGDNTRLLAEIGSFPFRPIEDSIRDLYRWYEARRAEIDPQALRFDG